MVATITQRRWASAGTAFSILAFLGTIGLLIAFGSDEIRVRRDVGYTDTSEDTGEVFFTREAVTSTVTIFFLVATLLFYLRFGRYCSKIVKGKNPHNPLECGADPDTRNDECDGCCEFLNWLIVGFNFATLVAAFVVNLRAFGLHPTTPLQITVYVYGFGLFGPVALAAVVCAVIVAVAIPVCLCKFLWWGLPRFYHFLGRQLKDLWTYLQTCWTVWQREEQPLVLPAVPAVLPPVVEKPAPVRVLSPVPEEIEVRFHSRCTPTPPPMVELSIPPPSNNVDLSSIAPPSGEYTVTDGGNLYSQIGCSLCGSKLEAHDDLRKLDCGHLFHRECLTTRGLTMCPECIV